LSDVVGDDPAVVGSGPLSPDHSTFSDALAVLDRYDVDAPRAVRDRLERRAR
jgi:hydroxypyruvate reductase